MALWPHIPCFSRHHWTTVHYSTRFLLIDHGHIIILNIVNIVLHLFLQIPPFVGWSKDWVTITPTNYGMQKHAVFCSLKGHHWSNARTKLPLYPDTCWLAPHAGWHHWSIKYHEGFNPFIIDWNCQHFSVWHRLKIGYPRIWLLIIIMHGKITSRTRPPKFDSLTDI